jgi:hypothetical protein
MVDIVTSSKAQSNHMAKPKEEAAGVSPEI